MKASPWIIACHCRPNMSATTSLSRHRRAHFMRTQSSLTCRAYTPTTKNHPLPGRPGIPRVGTFLKLTKYLAYRLIWSQHTRFTREGANVTLQPYRQRAADHLPSGSDLPNRDWLVCVSLDMVVDYSPN